MARHKIANNPYQYIVYEDVECVEFETIGKHKHKVIVDKELWDEYLKNFSWTAIHKGKRVEVQTSINKQPKKIWRVIIEHTRDELDYWDSTIDHKNRNPLDNRECNLEILNASILNSTNVSRKCIDDMWLIYPQLAGYKVHYSIAGEPNYEHFKFSDYESKAATLAAAKKYRDEKAIPNRERKIKEMFKKTRDVEFERGLRDKLKNNEIDEVLSILKKYDIIAKQHK